MYKDLLKAISIILGTLIGAGFASGKEIYIFFTRYGKFSLIGITMSTILTLYIINSVIKITRKHNIKNNNEFINIISKGTNVSTILKNIINTFLLISFYIMIAGFCAYFKQEFGVPIIISGLGVAIIIYSMFLKNIEGIIKICSIIEPILIITVAYIILVNIFSCSYEDMNIELNNSIFKAIFSGILYSSYNSIILIPIIISTSHYIKSKKENKIFIIVTGIILIMLITGICHILRLADFNIESSELPILKILEKNKIQRIIYSIIAVIAMFTSAVSTGFGILGNIKNKKTYKNMALILCITSIPIAYIGFGNLIVRIYPVFGLIGIMQIILIFIKTKQDKYNNPKTNLK